MEKLISIIVPVYKVEDYLECCLDSLYRQSMPEIEIILIDDASPDRCGEICDSYAAKDTRFRVIHFTENRGIAAVRNYGIRSASCDYVMFVDSDDWVSDDFCKAAYQCALQNHADLVMFNYQRVKDSTILQKDTEPYIITRITREEAIDLLFTKVQNYSWNKLFHRKLFAGINFPESCFYEDVATIYKLVLKASDIFYMDNILYYYRLRSGSITADTKKYVDGFKMRMIQCKDLWTKGYSTPQFLIYLNNLGMSYCIRNKINYSNPDYAFLACVLRQNKNIPKEFSWKRKILFVLFKYCPPAFELICNLLAR